MAGDELVAAISLEAAFRRRINDGVAWCICKQVYSSLESKTSIHACLVVDVVLGAVFCPWLASVQ